jgi:voltage-gated potassium channel Kch
MTRQVPLSERLRYQFDKSMAAGPIALIGWLAVVIVIIIVAAALFLAVTRIAPDGAQPESMAEALWQSLMRSMDAGTVAGDTGWPYRIVNLIITFAGIFIFSALIGILSTGLGNALDDLRKGRSNVLETDHTVILNWSASIFDIISELTVANASKKRAHVVIMANKDKVAMEDEIAAKVENLRTTKVICRSGDPTDLYDLAIVGPENCRSVIVLSPEEDDPDSQVIKTVLALVHDPKRRSAKYQIAAEIRDGKNAEITHIVGGSEVQLVMADDLISKIVVHSSRQSGLSAVYSELLDFDGCEIYTAEQPELAGKSFGEAIMAYEACSLIGLANADGSVKLNPPMDTVIQAGQKAIIIAEDDAAIKLAGHTGHIEADRIVAPKTVDKKAERTLIMGWNRRGPMIAFELSRYVAPGSLLTVVADTPSFESDIEAMAVHGDNMKVEHRVIDITSRAALDTLNVPSYDHVMVLGYSDDLPPQPADTKTLVALLHLRKIAEAAGRHISVVSEMTDVRNRELAEVTRADDFVVSNKLVSLMLAQASENEYLAAIFDDLLDEEGSEIYMRNVADYVDISKPVTFHTIAEAARRRGEVAFGYRRIRKGAADDRNMGGVVVNPVRGEALDYLPADKIIVLAED